MSQHTKGPWVATFNTRERTCQIDTADGRGTVVQPGAVSWVPDVHIIAAAPMLLEAVEALLEYGPEDLGSRDLARAALAQAKGA